MAAAKSEGALGLLGPPGGTDVQQVLANDFQNQFGIQVNYLSGNGGQLVARVLQERAAGQYQWDAYVGGTTGMLTSLSPVGALQPVEPALVLPDLTNPTSWIGDKLWFADQAHSIVLLGLGNRAAFAVNPNLVDPSQFTSYRDLLDPQWNGKIGIGRDPRQGGPGFADFLMLYERPDLGPDFITAFAKQNLVIFTDDWQALDALGQGKLPILFSPDNNTTVQLIQAGVPIQLIPPQQMKEGGNVTPGPAALTMLDRAPHPSAAKLYVNWALSKDPQTAIAKALGTPSLCTDVPNPLPAWTTADPSYVDTYSDQTLGPAAQMQTLLNQVFGSS